MQVYDIIILVILAAATLWGVKRGLVTQIASIVSIGASYFVAYNFRDQVAAMIDYQAPFNMFLAMLILFVGTSAAVWIFFGLVRKSIEKANLKGFDRQIGGLVGFAQGVLIAIVVTFFALTLLPADKKQAIVDSKSGYYITVLLDKATPIMPKEVHQVLGPYIDDLDQQLGGNGGQTPEAGQGGEGGFMQEIENSMRQQVVDEVRDRFTPQNSGQPGDRGTVLRPSDGGGQGGQSGTYLR